MVQRETKDVAYGRLKKDIMKLYPFVKMPLDAGSFIYGSISLQEAILRSHD